ncbi:uncharacterized protein (TIGR00290 family) [Hydrogenivirga caldilitoris]|uniref:Uncharacterized protein (TIGR00290 family) n=1 Tax=Hydrogenivirga caldilitoris TaxID=246264 RepID=A0A497XSD9_9AQUI|nr:hypothetical protein [Hydrogenivirga caldilitoris]RLJ70052.1 uncharacterized protein (TIGR00290 family) [Hydrogenivirga caldilitoris]
MASGLSFILWSGGKDSYLSYRKAISRGLVVKYALSYVEERSRRLIGCYLRESVIREQVKRLGLEFIPVYGSKRKGDFGKKLLEILSRISPVSGVFGDIYQLEHRMFIERICSELGIRAVFPLWYMDEELLLREVLELSKPFVVCRRVRKLPTKFLGVYLGAELLEFLHSRGYSKSGENGEYQTFVMECKDFKLDLSFGKRFRRSYYECIDMEVK